MVRLILTFFGIIIFQLLIAQQVTPTIISCGGGIISNTNAKLTFTIGEPVTGYISDNSSKFTQGFQQIWRFGVGISEILENNSLVVFPNPTSEVINVKLKNPISENSFLELIDNNGKLLIHQNIEVVKIETKINLSDYKAGVYLLKVSTHSGKTLGIFKILKSN